MFNTEGVCTYNPTWLLIISFQQLYDSSAILQSTKIQIILELCELQFTSSLRPLSSSSCCCSWRQLCLSQLPSCGQVWSAFHSPQRIKSDLQIWFFFPGEHQVTVYASHWTVATSEKITNIFSLMHFLGVDFVAKCFCHLKKSEVQIHPTFTFSEFWDAEPSNEALDLQLLSFVPREDRLP